MENLVQATTSDVFCDRKDCHSHDKDELYQIAMMFDKTLTAENFKRKKVLATRAKDPM